MRTLNFGATLTCYLAEASSNALLHYMLQNFSTELYSTETENKAEWIKIFTTFQKQFGWQMFTINQKSVWRTPSYLVWTSSNQINLTYKQ